VARMIKNKTEKISTAITLGLFIISPSVFGADCLAAVDTTLDAQKPKVIDATTINKPKFKTPGSGEYQQILEMNGKLYKLTEAQVLVPLKDQEAAKYNQYREEAPVVKNTEKSALPELTVETKPAVTEEEINPLQAQNQEQAQGEAVNAPQVVNTEVIPPEANTKEDSAKETVKDDRATGETTLNLSVEGKPGQARNHIKLEGIPEGIQQQEEAKVGSQIKARKDHTPSTTGKDGGNPNVFLPDNKKQIEKDMGR